MSIFGGLSTPKWLDPQDLFSAGEQSGKENAATFMRAYDKAHEEAIQKPARDLALAHGALDLQAKSNAINMQETQMRNTSEDQSTIPQWLSSNQDRWLKGDWSGAPTPKSEAGWKMIQGANQMASKSIQQSVALDATADFNKRVDALRVVDPSAAGQFAQYIGQPTVPPQVLQGLTQAETNAQITRNKQTADKERPNAVKILDEVSKEKSLAQQAKDAGDDAAYQQHTERANTLRETVTKGVEEQTVGWDDQGRPIVSFTKGAKGGAAAGGNTVGTMSLQQQKEMKYQNAAQLINDLQKNLKPEDVGARGTLGEYVLDRGMAQLDPKFANKDRISNRSALTILRESLMREVTDDTRRFSAQDREDISKALPSSGAFESYPDAMERMKKVQGIIIDRARNYAERAGQPIPLFAQSKEEIAGGYKRKKSALDAAVSKGNLSKAEADAEAKQEYDKAMEALTKFH